jgi:hypothetical protein
MSLFSFVVVPKQQQSVMDKTNNIKRINTSQHKRMRFAVTTSALLYLVLLGATTAFIPKSPSSVHSFSKPSSSSSSSSRLADIPSTVNLDVTLPPWLVENGNAILHSFENIQQPFWSTLVSSMLTSTTSLPSSLVDPSQQLELVQSLLTPWHLEAVAAFGLGSALLRFISSPEQFDEAPYLPGTTTYDPQVAAAFYQQRPLAVVKRVLKLALLTGSFNTGLIFDWLVLGKFLKDENYTALRRNEPRRAKLALRLCEQLGPTFIKLGQALSIRTDLIPEAYALELRQLQDAVPPFDSNQARSVLQTELGVATLNDIFATLSELPVASASIGQVYRGTLAETGQEVAVKVQRPGILAEIALDLHVLRILTPIQTVLQNAVNGVATTQEDIDTAVALVDEWGRGFVAETDYRLEADNTRRFEQAMRQRGLEAVCAPPVIEELVRDKVLVTEWVAGTRLDRDASPDVPRLCGVAINAYLTMLLDTGVLRKCNVVFSSNRTVLLDL